MLPWNVEDLTFDATRFSGVVRLFPLGELVLFPHVMQPLHIFEQRYRDMLNDALDGDGLIAMSLPAPGEVKDKQGRPALLPQICVGKVVSHHRLDDGRYNVMLLGVHRARIVRDCEAAVNALVYEAVSAYGGSISAEHGIGALKREALVQHKSAVALALMRSIKAALDPAGIMNPGRLL